MSGIELATHRAAVTPPPDDSSPPSMSGRQRTVMRFVLVVIGALLALGSLVSLGFLATGLGGMRVVTDSKPLPANLRELTVDTGDVPVMVRVVANSKVSDARVDLRLVTNSDNTQLAVTEDGDSSRATLRDDGSGFLWFDRTGELTIILPPDVAKGLSVTVNQQAGSLTTDATLRQLVAETDGGVTLGGSARSIDVDARGDITTSSTIAVADSFKAQSDSGSISTDFRAAPRTTEATAGGDVKVQLPAPGPYRVRAESDRGTSITVPQTPSPTASQVTARSENGNVEVTELR